jgi:PKD repeat protein
LLDVTDAGVTVLEDPSQGPYDGADDTLVGVINQSSAPINNLTLTSTSPIFAFDGDGICSGFFGVIAGCPFGVTGYEGPGTSFSQISQDFTTGGVSFSGGVPVGATAYFSLEAPLSASSIVAPHYVALGDSVAAGEGIGYGWIWNSSTNHWESGSGDGSWDLTYEPEQCHQTPQGYPHVVAAELGSTLTDLACTGAGAFNGLLGERVEPGGGPFGLFGGWSAAAQLGSSIGLPGSAPPNPEYDAAEPELVTLTLGADDVNFQKIVEDCYTSPCSTDQHRLDAVLAQQEGNLSLVLDEIQRRGTADGRVPLTIVTDYYSPFPRYDVNCPDLQGSVWGIDYGVDNSRMQFLIKAEERLNHNIASVAARKHVLVLPTSPLFAKHKFCSSMGPWVYGPSIDATVPPGHNPAPFHPTPDGQQAIGEAMAKLASSRLPVSAGSSVHVGLPYGSLDFANVASAGEAAIIPGQSLQGTIPPASVFAMTAAYEIVTSALYSGPITVSLPSSTALSLFHYIEGAWHEVPSTFNGSFVSGVVESLSPFALGTPVSPVHARVAPIVGSEAPDAVHFDATASAVEDGSGIASYSWSFGDGEAGTGASPTHVYTRSGSYTVTVTVTAEDGAVDTATQEVTVTHIGPQAQLSGPTSGTAGTPLSFSSAGSSAHGGYAGQWEFGDGSAPLGGLTASHAFAAPGAYQVILRIRDEEGDIEAAALPVTIGPAPASADGHGQGGVLSAATGVRVSILRTISRDRRGRLVVRLRCAPGAVRCNGTIKLRSRLHGRMVTLGVGRYSIAPGATAAIAVVPTTVGKRAVQARRLTVNVVATEAGGLAVSTNASLAPTRRHRRP